MGTKRGGGGGHLWTQVAVAFPVIAPSRALPCLASPIIASKDLSSHTSEFLRKVTSLDEHPAASVGDIATSMTRYLNSPKHLNTGGCRRLYILGGIAPGLHSLRKEAEIRVSDIRRWYPELPLSCCRPRSERYRLVAHTAAAALPPTPLQ